MQQNYTVRIMMMLGIAATVGKLCLNMQKIICVKTTLTKGSKLQCLIPTFLPVFLHRQELVSQATPFTERGRVWLVRLGEEPWYEEHHRTINASRVTGFLSGALNSSEYY